MTNPLDLPFSRPEVKAVHEASTAMFSQVFETLRSQPEPWSDTSRSITSAVRTDALTFEFEDLFNDQYSVAELKKANSTLGDRTPGGSGGFFDSIQNALEDIAPPGFPEPPFLRDLGDRAESLYASRTGLNVSIDDLFREFPGDPRSPLIGFADDVPTVSFCPPDKAFAKFAKSIPSISTPIDALDRVAHSIPAPHEVIGDAVGSVGKALHSIPAPHEVIGDAVGAVGKALHAIPAPHEVIGSAVGAIGDALDDIPTPVDAINDLVEALPSPPEPIRRFLDPFGLFD